ncbi:MAG: hypothetical protein ACRCSV_05035 [Chlamydiales bacterium]
MNIFIEKQLFWIWIAMVISLFSCSNQKKFRRNKLSYYYEKKERIGRFSREENYKIPPLEARTRELYPWEK